MSSQKGNKQIIGEYEEVDLLNLKQNLYESIKDARQKRKKKANVKRQKDINFEDICLKFITALNEITKIKDRPYSTTITSVQKKNVLFSMEYLNLKFAELNLKVSEKLKTFIDTIHGDNESEAYFEDIKNHPEIAQHILHFYKIYIENLITLFRENKRTELKLISTILKANLQKLLTGLKKILEDQFIIDRNSLSINNQDFNSEFNKGGYRKIKKSSREKNKKKNKKHTSKKGKRKVSKKNSKGKKKKSKVLRRSRNNNRINGNHGNH